MRREPCLRAVAVPVSLSGFRGSEVTLGTRFQAEACLGDLGLCSFGDSRGGAVTRSSFVGAESLLRYGNLVSFALRGLCEIPIRGFVNVRN